MAITSLFASFDDNQFTSITGVSVLATDPYKPASRHLANYVLARSDRTKTNSAFYTQKLVTVKVAIQAASRAASEQALDQLIALLQGISKKLVLSQGVGVRSYTCTLNDMVVQRSGGSYVEVDFVFLCDDVFGYDNAYTTVLSLTGITSSTRGDAVPFGGSAPWQVPLIVIFYSALTGGTSKTVVIGNSSTGQQITVTRTWTVGDRLEIDVANRTVKVNGTEVIFTGTFPEFAPVLGNWSYSDTFTTRTFNATITYYKRYI